MSDKNIIPYGAEKMLMFILLLFMAVSPAYGGTINDEIDKIENIRSQFSQISDRLDKRYQDEKRRIEKEYYLKINLTYSGLIQPPEPKGMFETTAEYRKRLKIYEKKTEKAERARLRKVKEIQKKFNLRFETAKAEVRHLKKKLRLLEPLVKELEKSQKKMHGESGKPISVTLFEPDADNYRFPMRLTMEGKSWDLYWNYTERKKAQLLWQYRSALVAEPLFQLECDPTGQIIKKQTAIIVKFLKTGESRKFIIDRPADFEEILSFREMESESLPAAELLVALNNVIKGPLAGMEFIYISPRTFNMGSPRQEEGRWANETHHPVKLTKGFYMQTTEVTQEQWRQVMGYNPSQFQDCGSDCPVENIYWGEAQEFILRLNAMEKTERYRLPTEAEWEFAARAGSKERWTCGNTSACMDDYAWYSKNSEKRPHGVAGKKSNLWGLYDMHGNVAEWCSDWFGSYPDTKVVDPSGPFRGKFRVARGGSWYHPARSCRSADRNVNIPGDKSSYLGFRLVMSAP